MATINHKTYNEGTETFKDFSVYDGKDTLIFKVDGSAQSAAVTGTLSVSGASTFNGLPTVNIAADNTTVGIFHTGGGTANKGLKISTFSSVNDNAGVTLDAQTSTGVLAFATVSTERMRITATGNVGIGTNTPNTQLEVSIAASVGGVLRLNNARTALFDGDVNGSIQFSNNEATAGASGVRSEITSLLRDVSGKTDVVFTTAGSGVAATEKLRILADGGITFNGDTLQVNALNDYETGTFTPSVAFGGGSTGITYFDRVGNYTKIGRQIFVTLYVALTNSGSSTGSATIEGLPFTNGNVNRGNQAVGSIRFDNITYTGTLQVSVPNSTTQISFQQVTEAGTDALLTDANFNGASEMSISLSYFV